MSMSEEWHVVLGGSGAVGNAIVRQLSGQGRRVRAINRGGSAAVPEGVELLAADIADPQQAIRACRDAAVVYLCTNPPYERWASLFPPMIAGALAGAEAAAARLVFADNLYMYAPTSRPLTEDLPYAPITRKGRLRARLATTLLDAHRQGRVRVALGRASNFYGPGVIGSSVGERFFTQLLAGKKVDWLGRADLPHALSFVPDFAAGLITLGSREEALGRAWHIPAAEPLTGQQYVALAAEAAGVPARPKAVSTAMLRMAGLFSPTIRELVEMQYEFTEPYLLDGGAFTRAFGGAPTPHREAFRRAVAWYRQRADATGLASEAA